MNLCKPGHFNSPVYPSISMLKEDQPDAGVTTLANKPPEPCKYRMNGEITAANAPFEQWLGRHVHMSGEITWQFLPGVEEPVPATAPGIFRIN